MLIVTMAIYSSKKRATHVVQKTQVDPEVTWI